MPTMRTAVLCAAVALLATTASAVFPHKMNYQVMLTDDADQPLANQQVQMDFAIYAQESGGTPLWTEQQYVTTNSIGVVSVVLGAVQSIGVWSFDELWLEVEVNGEVLSPRRPLLQSMYAAVALQASNAWNLADMPAEEYALCETLAQSGIINSPGNPLEWTKLKSVPAGFADGSDDVGPGDGHSLDASDGSPEDALYVQDEGIVRVGQPSDILHGSRFTVRSIGETAAEIRTYGESPAMLVCCQDATIGNPQGMYVVLGDTLPDIYADYPVALNVNSAYYAGDAGAAIFGSHGDEPTVNAFSLSGTGTAVRAAIVSTGTGYSGHFIDGDGVFMERDAGYQTLEVTNSRTGGAADGAWIYTENGAAGNTWTLYSRCYQGESGRFTKYTDDNNYAAHVIGASVSSEGLYVQGTVVSTGTVAKSVETSRGREAIFGVNAPESEVVASGTAKLTAGRARVEFDRLFTESIDTAGEILVTATPTGAWSALYTESIDAEGFVVRSGAGDPDVEFHWMAVGRAADSEQYRSIVLPDPEEDARLAAQKEAENASRRAAHGESHVVYERP